MNKEKKANKGQESTQENAGLCVGGWEEEGRISAPHWESWGTTKQQM